ncbi:twin-arginine translocase TatA/TatE family subunit [Salinarimonas ramus]|uniref:Sec-independent protein translocase protein TatA n=1 Tax=Salinarimonas ramus TaxID=690164 RepID=A0A917QH97_9HYPH|nr:twin-arginine translocase TatA/TatE family subunit [Salinarimonas ramus]GGK49779.1 Sec-independent protein translocase protein TatA [Salinarimonas ramus]
MGGASIWHWIVVGLIVVLLFGRGKISAMMGDVAQGIKAFKKGMAEDEQPAQGQASSEPARSIEHQPGEAAPSAHNTNANANKAG